MAMFKLSVFSDEITQDFGRALEIASKEFGLGYVELRGMWGKNITALDGNEIAEARRLLERFRLRVSSLSWDMSIEKKTLAPADYVQHMALLLDLQLDPEHRPGVVENFARIMAIAQLVNEFPLPDNIEAAPVFEP